MNTSQVHGYDVNKRHAKSMQKMVFIVTLEFLLTITWDYTILFTILLS